MQQTDSGDRVDNDDETSPDDSDFDDLDEDDEDEPAFDWIVFLFRASAVITFGATLITSINLSQNLGAEWAEVMRFAILPFVGGMLVLAAGELIDRQSD